MWLANELVKGKSTTLRRLSGTLRTTAFDPRRRVGLKRVCVRRQFTQSSAPSLHLYDSLSQSVLEVGQTEKGFACYTCGPTTYAPAHVGHARMYVCLDILRRCIEFSAKRAGKPSPLFVMNITDVDDKILAAAEDASEAPLELARRFEASFWRDMEALNCLPPHVVTRVTDYVDSHIIPYIGTLVDSGIAYQVDEGVYFDVRQFEDRAQRTTRYGKLAPPSNSEDFYTRLEVASTQKRDPRDFVLWKKRKDGERMYWSSPWGEGRPGWHIECSVMIEAVQDLFKDTHTFSMHVGGVDLKFPHHTNEIAQAEAYRLCHSDTDNVDWIPHWVHFGHLHIDGLKMSKSLKNFVTIEEFMASEDKETALSSPSDDFRLWCLGLSGHYRGAATFSANRIADARVVRSKLVRFLVDGEAWVRKVGGKGTKLWDDDDSNLFLCASQTSLKCTRALMEDFDGPACVVALLNLASIGSSFLVKRSRADGPIEPLVAASRTVRQILSLVGFSDATCRAGLKNVDAGSHSSRIVGGADALLDEVVRFRAEIRRIAVNAVRSGNYEPMKRILEICGEGRDRVFPALGIELLDGRIDDDGPDNSGWKYCLPVVTRDGTEDDPSRVPFSASKSRPIRMEDVRLEDMFRVGQYEAMFAEFDHDGIPNTKADGSQVSNRMLKKLRKKREKHQKRLDSLQTSRVTSA